MNPVDIGKASAESKPAAGGVKGFLREFWLWIVIPFVLVILGLLVLMWLAGSGDSASPFQYTIF
jgi:hypothetical protein